MQTLIAGAGGKSQPHSVSAAEGDALSEDRSQFQEPPDRSQFQDSFNSDGGPQEPASPITLTQLSRVSRILHSGVHPVFCDVWSSRDFLQDPSADFTISLYLYTHLC